MKVVLIAAISANGKIAERADHISTDWTSKEDLKFFIEKTKELGVVVMGRRTFETFGKPLKERRLIVMTRDPASHAAIEGVEFSSLPPKALLEKLAGEDVQQIALAGGGKIYSAFLAEGLVDELFLTVEPVLFGVGINLADGFDRINLQLLETRKLNDQAVLLHYKKIG